MHWFKRNIGDYHKKAGRLTMLQHGAYTLLMDSCYDREQFPTKEEAIEWVWASTTEEVQAVEFVLSRFFTLEDGVYVQHRIEEEINAYQAKSENNKRIALEREAKRRKERTKKHEACTNEKQSVNESAPNQEPITNNQELETNKDLLSANADAISVLTYLNEVCGTKYKHTTKSHIQNINARISDGHTVEECKLVIDYKFSEWGDDQKMSGYLRPQTLFGTSNFQGYLMAAKSKPKHSRHDLSNIEYQSGSF